MRCVRLLFRPFLISQAPSSLYKIVLLGLPVLTRRATHGIPLGHIEVAENKRELARR
jgi:hypothetical protein